MTDADEDKLAQARRRVAAAKRIIALQQELVEEIEGSGGDVLLAQSVLDSFMKALATFEDELTSLLGTLKSRE